MSIIGMIFTALLGLCWGSFLNVLIVRTVSGESILLPPSKCPKCQHRLYWWHNIPLLSFLILKGKCYFCNKSISIRYPLVELVGMGIFLFAFYRYVSLFDAISVILIFSLLFVLSFTDIEIKKMSVFQLLVVILAGILFNRYNVLNSVLGCLVAGGFVSALILMGRNLLKTETFGVGDVYLLGAFGAIIGFDCLLVYLLILLFVQFLIVLPKYVLSLIQDEQGETLKYLIIFVITCLFLYVSKNISFIGSNLILMCFLAGMLFCAFKLTKSLFVMLKSSQTRSYCPIAPAVLIAVLVFLC